MPAIQPIHLAKWVRIALCVLLLSVGFGVVGYWSNAEAALLLLWWIPVLYGLATLGSGRREIVEQLRSDAFWFAVSRPKAYEHGFGYGRVFEWSEELVRWHAAQDYSKETTYHFEIGSGSRWVSGDAVGQSLDYHVGIRTNVLELPASEAQQLSALCRAYETAAGKCDVYFAMGWIVVVTIPFFLSFTQTLTALGISTWIVVWRDVFPTWSLRDRTQDAEFLYRNHVHVYTYFPGDDQTPACYLLCVRESRESTGPRRLRGLSDLTPQALAPYGLPGRNRHNIKQPITNANRT
jgi:hypothetical protein